MEIVRNLTSVLGITCQGESLLSELGVSSVTEHHVPVWILVVGGEPKTNETSSPHQLKKCALTRSSDVEPLHV